MTIMTRAPSIYIDTGKFLSCLCPRAIGVADTPDASGYAPHRAMRRDKAHTPSCRPLFFERRSVERLSKNTRTDDPQIVAYGSNRGLQLEVLTDFYLNTIINAVALGLKP